MPLQPYVAPAGHGEGRASGTMDSGEFRLAHVENQPAFMDERNTPHRWGTLN